MNSHPVPSDPYNPFPPPSHAQDSILHPSPFIPIRLPIFALVIWLNDAIIRILSIRGGETQAKRRMGHSRMLSQVVETVEEGEYVQLNAVGASRIQSSGSGGFGRKKAN
jgi:etoposide-induced 2.4 mRNA